MGIFGDLFGPSQKEREESYAKGVEAAKEGGLGNYLLYGDTAFNALFPDSFLDERYKSERAGYRDHTTDDDEDDE